MPFDLLAASNDTSISSSAVLFGADATNSASPSKFTATAVFDLLKTLDNTWSGQNTFAAGTLTTSKPFSITQTWDSAGTTFSGFQVSITNTASAAASKVFNLLIGGSSLLYVREDGVIGSDASFSAGMTFNTSTSLIYFGRAASLPLSAVASVGDDGGGNPGYRLSYLGKLSWAAGGADAAGDTMLARTAAGIVGLRGASDTGPAAFNFYTYGASPPSAPSASMALLYSDTSGGKIRIMARFPSGAAQVIATEP